MIIRGMINRIKDAYLMHVKYSIYVNTKVMTNRYERPTQSLQENEKKEKQRENFSSNISISSLLVGVAHIEATT